MLEFILYTSLLCPKDTSPDLYEVGWIILRLYRRHSLSFPLTPGNSALDLNPISAIRSLISNLNKNDPLNCRGGSTTNPSSLIHWQGNKSLILALSDI
ncbi:hypothetical protein TNCV_2642741 [Trichonephila clavipes]|nr:hypothetical protein TNCV_2642741 [Trichonephila clavipes]